MKECEKCGCQKLHFWLRSRRKRQEVKTIVAGKETEKRKGVGGNGNLIPASMQSPQERKENGRKGGIAKGKNAEKKRTLNEIAKALLEVELDKRKAREMLGDKADLLPSFDFGTILTMRQMIEASEGSSKAYEIIRDTAGFKPTEKQEITAEIMTDADRLLLEKVSKRQEKQD